MKKYKKLLIFGGTFSPVHNGHLRAMQACCAATSPDVLYVIPTATPPHKVRHDGATDKERMDMLHLAVGTLHTACPVVVSDIELLRAPTELGKIVPAMLSSYADVYKQVHNIDGMMIHDAICAVYLWRPELFTCMKCRMTVCLEDGEHLGQTMPEDGDTCLAATSCDAQAVREEILSVMKRVVAAH